MIRVSVQRPIGFRVADIGPGGKEYNVKIGLYDPKTGLTIQSA